MKKQDEGLNKKIVKLKNLSYNTKEFSKDIDCDIIGLAGLAILFVGGEIALCIKDVALELLTTI